MGAGGRLQPPDRKYLFNAFPCPLLANPPPPPFSTRFMSSLIFSIPRVSIGRPAPMTIPTRAAAAEAAPTAIAVDGRGTIEMERLKGRTWNPFLSCSCRLTSRTDPYLEHGRWATGEARTAPFVWSCFLTAPNSVAPSLARRLPACRAMVDVETA